MPTLPACRLIAVLAVALLSMAASAQTPAPAGTDSPEAILAALKHALVEAAQEQTVNVISSAFIDSSGALVESNYFDTEATVRGVRVTEYLPAPEQAAVDPTASLPASLQNARDGVCAVDAATRYRPTLLVSARTDLGQGRVNDADADVIKQHARGLISNSAAISDNWVLVLEDELASGLSQYDRLLTGMVPFDDADYALQWSLSNTPPTSTESTDGGVRQLVQQGISGAQSAARSAAQTAAQYASSAARYLAEANPIAPLNLPASDPAVTLYHELTLINRRTGATLHTQAFDVTLPAADSQLRRSPPQLASDVTRDLGPQLEAFFEDLEEAHACQLRQFAVLPADVLPAAGSQPDSPTQTLQIRIGAANNARPGDRFLIIETPWEGGQQTLNSNLVSSLSIGEIVQVDEFQSTLQVIAGNGSARDLKFALPF